MVNRIISFFLLSLLFTSCNKQSNSAFASADPIHIQRFDKALFELISSDDTLTRAKLIEEYPGMLELTGKAILNMRSLTISGFFDRLENFYSEPTLYALYKDALDIYDTIPDIEKQLGVGFAYLQSVFPEMTLPEVYMHVSGLSQNVLVDEDILSISIDKYMGENYPLYQDFFYDYQRRKMTPELVVPDYLAGWLMAEFPYEGKENVLLERMVYEGKIKYILSKALPDIKPYELMGYTEAEYEWCKTHQSILWKSIIERKHLYTPDLLTTSKYFDDFPATFLMDGAPVNIGTWIGWQIVNGYMKETNTTPEGLMKEENAQEILILSKYKP